MKQLPFENHRRQAIGLIAVCGGMQCTLVENSRSTKNRIGPIQYSRDRSVVQTNPVLTVWCARLTVSVRLHVGLSLLLMWRRQQ